LFSPSFFPFKLGGFWVKTRLVHSKMVFARILLLIIPRGLTPSSFAFGDVFVGVLRWTLLGYVVFFSQPRFHTTAPRPPFHNSPFRKPYRTPHFAQPHETRLILSFPPCFGCDGCVTPTPHLSSLFFRPSPFADTPPIPAPFGKTSTYLSYPEGSPK